MAGRASRVDYWMIWLAVGGATGLVMNLIGAERRHAPHAEVLVGMTGAGLTNSV